MAYISHKWGRTWYQVRGTKRSKGLPLVCLHGGPGGQSRLMTDLFKLADQRQVYIYDQLGGGRSSATSRNRWTIKTFVQELKILVDAWGLDEFHLFGASWGTTLALEYFLADRQHHVRSLIFQSPMFSAADWQRDADQLIDQLPAKEMKVIHYCHEIGATDAAVYQQAMEVYYARHVCRNKARSKLGAKYPNPNGARVYQHMWGASEFSATGTLKDYDRTADLGRINAPTLFICGEHDEARPATARRFAKQIPGASLQVIDGASHAILGERPGRLLKLIRGHLQAND
ncbi:MAG: proline iminopeptidase-family hydrolase [Proteobacteria bacterium]|nr:proline iminopeptidase-family hydrolase [Pseudomonadota bacterium]